MTSIILITCGVGAAVCGLSYYLVKKARNKWLKRSSSSSKNADSFEMKDIPVTLTRIRSWDDMRAEPLDFPLTREYPVIDDGTGKHFIFVTIVRPPPAYSARKEVI